MATFHTIFGFQPLNPFKVKGAAKIGEGYNIVHKDRCRQFCDLTPDCKFWTWYKVHCDK